MCFSINCLFYMLQSFYFAKDSYIIRYNFFSSNMSVPSFPGHILLYSLIYTNGICKLHVPGSYFYFQS